MNNITKSLGVGRSEEETNMSLDIASHPGRTGTDELGPSRYSLRVGEIDVLVVSDGVLTALPAATLAVNAGPAVLAAWLDDMVLPPAFDWPVNVVVVRSGGRTVLIDAGIGVEYKDFRRAGRLLHRLEPAGIDPASLTDVVLTHLHMDHIGGLLGDGVKGRLRPDLRVHVSAAEAEFWAAGADLSRTSMPPGIPAKTGPDPVTGPVGRSSWGVAARAEMCRARPAYTPPRRGSTSRSVTSSPKRAATRSPTVTSSSGHTSTGAWARARPAEVSTPEAANAVRSVGAPMTDGGIGRNASRVQIREEADVGCTIGRPNDRARSTPSGLRASIASAPTSTVASATSAVRSLPPTWSDASRTTTW